MATIGTLTYKLVAQTDEFKQGLTGSSRALRDQRRLFLDTRTPVERYNTALQRLEHLHKTGKLSNDVYARSLAKIKQEFATSTRAAETLGKAFPNLAKLTSPAGLALAAVGAAAGAAYAAFRSLKRVVSETSQQFEALDKVAKTSAALNLATKDLIGLRQAASEFTGMAAPQFDMALQRMTRRIAEAAQGTGEAVKALQTLGVDAGRLAAMSSDQAFLEIAAAMQKIESPGERLRIAFKLFDSEGARLVTTLNAGRDAIEDVSKQAKTLSQAEFINFHAIEAANDAMSRLKLLFEGVFSLVATEFAPLVEFIAKDLTSAVLNTEPIMAKLRETIFDVAETAAMLYDVFTRVVTVTVHVVKVLEPLLRFLARTSVAAKTLIDTIEGLGTLREAFAEDPTSATAYVRRMREEFEKMRLAGIDNRDAEAAALEQQLAMLENMTERQATSNKLWEESSRLIGSSTERIGGLFGMLGSAMETVGAIAGKADGAARKRLAEDFGNEARPIHAIEAGSLEARRIAMSFKASSDERIAKASEEIVKVESKALVVLESILDAISGGTGGVVLADAGGA